MIGQHLKRADQFIKAGNFEAAEREVGFALKEEPTNIYALAYRERIHRARIEHEQQRREEEERRKKDEEYRKREKEILDEKIHRYRQSRGETAESPDLTAIPQGPSPVYPPRPGYPQPPVPPPPANV